MRRLFRNSSRRMKPMPPFSNLEQSVRDDIATLKASPLIPDTVDISGFIYDMKTGRLLPVT